MAGDSIKEYWDKASTESMYDKNLLEAEIRAVLRHIGDGASIIDIGCGEGEGTARYAQKAAKTLALDFSETRLSKLKELDPNINTIAMDMLKLNTETVRDSFDIAITQRSLINLRTFEEQMQVISSIHGLLKDGGRYIMLEGFSEGTEALNAVRVKLGMPPIEVKWHNVFMSRERVAEAISGMFALEYSEDFSLYFFLTRAYNAKLKYPDVPSWKSPENELARDMQIAGGNELMRGLSRLELLVWRKL